MTQMKFRIFLAAAAALFSCPAFADCPAVGTMVSTTSVDEVKSQLVGRVQTLKKGEFETTAEFEARTKTISEAAADVTLEMKGRFWIAATYDADNGRFIFSQWLMDRLPTSSRLPIYALGVGVSSTSKSLGDYTARNSFGVTATVEKSEVDRFAVFDREGKSLEQEMWRFDDDAKKEWYLQVPRDTARALKESLRIAVTYTSKAPFLIEGNMFKKPTLDQPEETRYNDTIFVGDIHCVIVMDDKGTALKTIQPRY